MATHEWRTDEFERLVRLNKTQHWLNKKKTSKDYKDKDKRMGAFSDNNCSGTQSDILFFVYFLPKYALKVG